MRGLVPALLLPVALATAQPGAKSLRAVHTSSAVRLDGRLDDAAWAAADSITDLRQVEPDQDAVPLGRTVVRVLVADDALIVGVRCDYARGTPVVTYARERDASLENEDHIVLVLDTFLDGRSGYVFAVNANGARYDALVTGNGGSKNSNWDAVWEAATVRTPTWWSVEIRIPVKSLLFKPGLESWGFNVQRRTQALQETDRWASPSRDYQVTQVSRAGTLVDIPRFAIGLGLSVRPAVTSGGGYDSAGAALHDRSQLSLDVTQRLGANTIASVTVNTDFAEAEADTRRVNLTRFPLFFPEKRTFFLEGADIFEFGLGLGEDVLPFFSRRAGLIDGAQVPINAGVKVNGRLGGTNFGALVVDTRNVDTLTSSATMGVVRLTQNLGGESSAGMIATFGDPLGRAGSWLAGQDFTFSTSKFRGDKNLRAGVWALGIGRNGLAGDRTAAGFTLEYPNDRWDVAASYKRIGDGFDPSLGFVPRAGVHKAILQANWQPRPEQRIGPLDIRQCFWENELIYVAGLAGGWQSYEYFMAPVNCRLESGDRFEFNFVPTGERLTEPFEVSNGVTLPAGEYHFQRFRLEAGLAAKRTFTAQATWWFGSFYDGSLNQYILTSSWKPTALFIAELSGERDVGVMPEGRFVENVVGMRLRFNVSPDLQVASYVQYADNSDALGANTRLRWTFDPAGDLYIVYNHNLRTRDPMTLERSVSLESNMLLVKIQYALRY